MKQVHAAFELLLDVVAAQERLSHTLRASRGACAPPLPRGLQDTAPGGVSAFLETTALELASLGAPPPFFSRKSFLQFARFSGNIILDVRSSL